MMTNKLPSGTVTFLFTDIEGSTLKWELQPEWMQHAFARQETILRETAASHGGYVYKMIGDAFQIAFDTALNALDAAIHAQQALQTEPWGDAGPLRVRMALHTGVTEEREDDYVGPLLNRLARLLGVSQGGQILMSQATYELVCDFLPEGVGLRDMGVHRLKDLSRPEHIYQVTAPGLPNHFQPIQTLDSFPHNLPLQLTSFVGREHEIQEVKRPLLGERFVTLTGPGGTGKTRLGLQVAAELLELFPDGAWLVEFASIADAVLVPQTVAAVLGIRESTGRPIMTLLTEYLRNRELLLILDNCEHLLPACAGLVAALLKACPNLCILATSREALDIPGEVTIRIPSLSVPDAHRIPSIEMLTQYESVRLFIERAELIQPDFALTHTNASSIAQICRRLDGIPLAIELAVARVKVMNVEQVASRLDDRFRLLTGGSRNALPRHQTLRALIDWSYDLLSEAEKKFFRRLSVFAGGWTLEAAEAICSGDGIEPYDVLDLLTQLVNKSLVLPDTDSESETHYRLLETIRQYAREKFVDVCIDDRVRERHLDYYLKLAENAEPELRSPRQVAWLDRIEKEVDNIRAALEWAVVDNVEAGLRMASALYWFWHIRNHKKEGINWLERMIAAVPGTRGNEQTSGPQALIRGKALNVAGSLLMMQGMLEQADIYSRESLKIHEDLGLEGRQGVAHALWNLSQLASQRANTERARELSNKSLALYRELNDKFGIAQCLDDLGGVYLSRGDYQQAREIWEEDLKLRKEMGDRDGIGWSLSCLGDVAFYQGDLEKAMALFTESLDVFHEVGNHWAASRAISGTGIVLLAQGDFERAVKLFEEALAFGREMGDPNEVAGRRYDLARVARSMGDYKKAEKFYEETLEYVRNELHNKDAVARALVDLGEVAWARGDLELATRRYEESLAIGREIQAPFLVAGASSGLGRVAYARGEYQKAHTLLAEALTILKAVGDPWNKAYVLHGLAILAVAEHHMERAVRLFGATETTYLQLRYLISPRDRDKHEADLAHLRATLGEERFTLLWNEGQTMTMDQAVEYALAV